MLTEEQKQKLRTAGYNDAKIVAYEKIKFGKPEEKNSFLSNVKADFNKRVNAGSDAILADQGRGSKALQTIGQGAGFVGDIGLEALKSVTPDALENKISSGIKKIAQTEPAQNVITKVSDWATKNPEAAKNLQAIVDIASLIPVAKGAQVGIKGVSKGTDIASASLSKGKQVIGDGITNTVGKVADPDKIMQRVARIPKGAQAKFEKASGESIGKYLNERGIYGDTEEISKQLYDRFSASKQAADGAIAELPGNFKPVQVKNALFELYSREKRVSAPGSLSPEFKRSRELVNKFNKEGLTMSEINEVKRMYERNVRLDFVKQNLPEGVARSTNIDNAMREWQFNQAEKLGLQNLPDLNKETRLAKQLLDDIGREAAGSSGNNAIPLSDIILLASGDPTVVAGYFVKKGFGSKKIQSKIAKKLYKGQRVDLPKAKVGNPRPGLEEFMKK